jgi:hypothetical protein
MPNKQNDDGRRAAFNARHGCSEKKDKTKVPSELSDTTLTPYARSLRCAPCVRRRATGVTPLPPLRCPHARPPRPHAHALPRAPLGSLQGLAQGRRQIVSALRVKVALRLNTNSSSR